MKRLIQGTWKALHNLTSDQLTMIMALCIGLCLALILHSEHRKQEALRQQVRDIQFVLTNHFEFGTANHEK